MTSPTSPAAGAAGAAIPAAELLPCPFCGAEPISHGIEPHKHLIAFAGFTMPDHKGSHVIECARCECGMIGDNKQEVATAWNRRAAHPSPSAISSIYREALERITRLPKDSMTPRITLLAAHDIASRAITPQNGVANLNKATSEDGA